MKFNKFKNIGIIASTALIMWSCDLDEFNPTGTTADAAWSTPEGFATAVNAAYDYRTEFYGRENGIFLGESGTDLWFNRENANYANQLTRYAGLTPTQGNPNIGEWPRMWAAINQCNAGINRIDDAGFTVEATKNEMEGQLRFLRAFYYYHIVETWGGVMLRTTETREPILTAERSPVEAFYDLMIEDLLFASEHLPISYGDEYSRATKKSAMGLLAKVYLTRGYYGDGATYYTLARDLAEEIIARSGELGIELWDDVNDLWDPTNNKRNKESLHTVSYSLNPALNRGGANRLHQFYMTNYARFKGLVRTLEYGNEDTRRLMPTRALLDFYDDDIDARYEASFKEVWIANESYTWTAEDVQAHGKDPSLIGTEVRAGIDTALYITKKSVPNKEFKPYVIYDRNRTYNESDGSLNQPDNFVQLWKFRDPLTRTNQNQREGFLDVFVMRFAEIYLIAAEAEVQLGNAAAAATYLNVIRNRAAKDGAEGQMAVTAAEVDLDFVLDERARELCGEMVRWYDLKRTRTIGSRIAIYNPNITEFRDHHYLRPIPQNEIDALLNGAEFGQNPGY
ncbi:RagB/SusD family nutrient uptake outer membrane protein [Belliella marina]|uniref:RagB/SusD family nutrient uptake outer membrane protein n=1 Tax=Belliella marina TaxID=1644146 RepID=A0ABW4VGM8_9BACT